MEKKMFQACPSAQSEIAEEEKTISTCKYFHPQRKPFSALQKY